LGPLRTGSWGGVRGTGADDHCGGRGEDWGGPEDSILGGGLIAEFGGGGEGGRGEKGSKAAWRGFKKSGRSLVVKGCEYRSSIIQMPGRQVGGGIPRTGPEKRGIRGAVRIPVRYFIEDLSESIQSQGQCRGVGEGGSGYARIQDKGDFMFSVNE